MRKEVKQMNGKIVAGNIAATHPGCTHPGCTVEKVAPKTSGIEATHPDCSHPGCKPAGTTGFDAYGRPQLRGGSATGLVALARN